MQQTLGVLLPTIRNSVHAAIVRAVEEQAFERDYNIVLCDTDFDVERERQYIDILIRRRAEGVLMIPINYGEDVVQHHLRLLARAGIAVMCMHDPLPHASISQVLPDNVGAGRDVTRHLIQLGHQRIAFFHEGLTPWQVSTDERLHGYLAALEEAKLHVDPRLILEIGSAKPFGCSLNAQFHAERVECVFRKKNRPTAVFAPSDILAIKLMSELRRHGLRVPEDVAVVGFGNIQMSAFSSPPLTTVRTPADVIGKRAAELLFEQLAFGRKRRSAIDSVVERVPCELILRASSRARVNPPKVGG